MGRKRKSNVSLAKVSAQNTMRLDGDGPTPERLAKLAGVTIMQKPGGARVAVFGPGSKKPVGEDGVVRIAAEALDRLFTQRRLGVRQVPGASGAVDDELNGQLYIAGDMLRQHWYRAGLGDAIGSVDLNRTGGGTGHPAWLIPSSEDVAYHRAKFRAARDGMKPAFWAVVFAICCGDATLERAGRDVGIGNLNGATAVALDRLRMGLEALAIQWGVIGPKPGNDNILDYVSHRRLVVTGDDVDAIIGRMQVANAAATLRRLAG